MSLGSFISTQGKKSLLAPRQCRTLGEAAGDMAVNEGGRSPVERVDGSGRMAATPTASSRIRPPSARRCAFHATRSQALHLQTMHRMHTKERVFQKTRVQSHDGCKKK